MSWGGLTSGDWGGLTSSDWGSGGQSLFLLLLSFGTSSFQSFDVLLVDGVVGSDGFNLLLSLVTLSSESLRSNQSLDFRSLVVLLVTSGLGGRSLDNVSADVESVDGDFSLTLLANVVGVLRKTEKLSDLVGSLRTKSSWGSDVSESLDIDGTLANDGEVEGSNIAINNSSTNTSSLSFTFSTIFETRGSWRDQESCSSFSEDTVLHAEAFFVRASSNLQDVTLVFFSKDLFAHELLDIPLDLQAVDVCSVLFHVVFVMLGGCELYVSVVCGCGVGGVLLAV